MPVKIHDPVRERIVRTLECESDLLALYEVPEGFVFYLEEAHLSVRLEGQIADEFAYIMYFDEDGIYARDLCQIWIGDTSHSMRGDKAIFPSGIRMEYPCVVCVNSDAVGVLAEGNISGLLVPEYV